MWQCLSVHPTTQLNCNYNNNNNSYEQFRSKLRTNGQNEFKRFREYNQPQNKQFIEFSHPIRFECLLKLLFVFFSFV